MMTILERIAQLMDNHTISGAIKHTPNVVVASPELYIDAVNSLSSKFVKGSEPHFHGMEILETRGQNILIVGFKEDME